MDSCNITLLSEFLKENPRDELKIIALQELLGLSGSKDPLLLIEDPDLGKLLMECLKDKNEIISKTACLTLVNISASESGTDYLVNKSWNNKEEKYKELLNHILDPDSKIADAACMTLCNISRQSDMATFLVDYIMKADIKIEDLINAFVKINYNSRGCNLNYLGALFSNLSQVCEFRRHIMDKNRCLIQKLLPFIQFQSSSIRRSGIVATVKNCCFETYYHEWLLGPDVDVLPYLLLPLAGSEEFSEEDNEKLPLELQYLGEDKEREQDTEIRKMLLEALHQLCATKLGREYFRNKNIYVILREYHKWEKEPSLLLVCENIVDILIRTEEEINHDNLKDIDIPDSYIKKFEEMDKQYLEGL